MSRIGKWFRITFLFLFLFINITGFSSAEFLHWMTSDTDMADDIGVNDMPPQWQQDILDLLHCSYG